MTTLVVLAKEPAPGRSKTRLSPPCTPSQAATLALAALLDTLDAVRRTPVDRRVVVLDGRPGGWIPEGFDVVPQRGGGLDARLAAAFDDVGGPTVLIGMDTPQVTPELLTSCVSSLHEPGTDAVLGLATDGGFWVVGLHEPDERAFVGVPMSEDHTGTAQLDRLRTLGLTTTLVARMRDIDTFADAEAVARTLPPDSHFRVELASVLSSDEPRGHRRGS